MTKSFSDLKPGDQVILEGLRRTIVTIDRVTTTQIIIGAYRFLRKEGLLIGSTAWERGWLEIATPELIAEIKAKEQISKAERLLQNIKEQSHHGNLIAALPHLEKAVDVLTSDLKAND